MFRKIYIGFSLLFLIYLVIPGPVSINDFPPLPNSLKSRLEGDTTQISNVAAYFSNNYRVFATSFYRQFYQYKTLIPLPLLRLNYPPEQAFTFIKDQTHSTYLEEYVHPLRDSFFINGLEPFTEDGKSRYEGADYVASDTQGGFYETKVTLRFYPSPLWVKLTTWFFINVGLALLWKLGRKVMIDG